MRAARGCVLLVLAVLATGCAPFRAGMPAATTPSPTAAAQGTLIAQQALGQAGAPYRYGGADPQGGFDCSGLVFFAHSRVGISVPRTAAAQFAAARRIELADIRPGDLLFYRLVAGSNDVTHVGIYTGQGRFVHAPQTGRRVTEASVDDPFYRAHLAGAGRLYVDSAGEGPRLKPR